jgi:hypothetical protein
MGHGVIAWIIIGVLAGWITGKLMKGSGLSSAVSCPDLSGSVELGSMASSSAS